MNQVVLVLGAMAVALVASVVLRKRKPQAPTQGGYEMPTQLDRSDFASPQSPWLVAVFTSSTCSTCADVATKAAVLKSSEVAVEQIDYIDDKDLHTRYGIDAVPLLVIADHKGVVQKGFIGPVKAQDLWAAMAQCREPGSVPPGCHDDSVSA
jgi:thioredoxin-related protein